MERIPKGLFQRPVTILCLFLTLSCLTALTASALYRHRYAIWPPEAEWDESPRAVVLKTDPGCVEIDLNYIPTVRIWGDGHIVWVEGENGRRIVLDGYLTHEEMTQLITKLISAGLFRAHKVEDVCLGNYLSVGLLNASVRVRVDPEDTQLSEVYDFLRTGAGTAGIEIIPETGDLFAYPIEEVDINPEVEAKYSWPDDRFGYSLEEIYTHTKTEVSPEELRFAWEIVNSGLPVVMSNDEVYWIAVVIPEMLP